MEQRMLDLSSLCSGVLRVQGLRRHSLSSDTEPHHKYKCPAQPGWLLFWKSTWTNTVA